MNLAALPKEVREIWNSRNDELPELPRCGWSWEQSVEPDYETSEILRKTIESSYLTQRQELAICLHVIEGYTLKETGEVFKCNGERVRQIIARGLRQLRLGKGYLIRC